MMVHPHDSDKSEADKKGHICRSLAGQGGEQVSCRRRRDLDIENEQRNGDGEYALRECFDACGFRGHGWSLRSAAIFVRHGDADLSRSVNDLAADDGRYDLTCQLPAVKGRVVRL